MQIIIPTQGDQGNRFEVSNTATKEIMATTTHMSGQCCLGKLSLLKPHLAPLKCTFNVPSTGAGTLATPTEFRQNQAIEPD